MVGYGQDVDKHFAVFMQENFGKKFKHAPIKKLKRIFNKMKSDAPALEMTGLQQQIQSYDVLILFLETL